MAAVRSNEEALGDVDAPKDVCSVGVCGALSCSVVAALREYAPYLRTEE